MTNTWIQAEAATGSLTLHHPRQGNPTVTSPLPEAVTLARVVNPAAIPEGSTVVADCRVTRVSRSPGTNGTTVAIEVTAIIETVATTTESQPDVTLEGSSRPSVKSS
jgi:hypothetical protein